MVRSDSPERLQYTDFLSTGFARVEGGAEAFESVDVEDWKEGLPTGIERSVRRALLLAHDLLTSDSKRPLDPE